MADGGHPLVDVRKERAKAFLVFKRSGVGQLGLGLKATNGFQIENPGYMRLDSQRTLKRYHNELG